MPKGKKPRLDAEDILEGRARADVRDLVALIHDVNPSGHDHLPARETARRYALKSRLQSLLVRRFPDELEVEPVPGEPHLASLRHRASRVDACHAVVAALDDDARSWVQRALDLGAGAAPRLDAEPAPPLVLRAPRPEAAPPPAEPRTPDELVAAGRDAVDAYDYDLARARLDAAVDQGSDEAAALLLALLVDILGADGEALALAPRLSQAARARPEVRALLALATARTGERAEALALLQGLPPSERGAAVFAALARRAAEAGDALGARRDLGEVRRRSPAHPSLGGLVAALDALRAPLEAEILRALAEGRVTDAYTGADALHARFPDSKVAERVTRLRDEERRRADAARLAREAEEAIVAGALGQARFLVIKARAGGLGADRAAGVEAQIAALEARERARAEAERVEHIVGLLAAEAAEDKADKVPGLLAYLALDARARAGVRARCALPQLAWLDETRVAEGSGAHARAAVAAVQALARAEADHVRSPQAALDLLAPHRKALASVPLAEAVTHAAQRALADDRHRRAVTGLEAAERASADMSDDALQRAKTLLEQVRARDLDDEARSRLHALERRVSGTLARRDRRRTVEDLRKNGEPLDAHTLLEQLLAEAEDPGERASYLEARAAVRAEIQSAWDVRIEGPPRGGASSRVRLLGPDQDDPPRSILPGGAQVVLAQSRGVWAFLWVIDIGSGEVRERVRIRGPAPLRLQRLVLEAGRLILVGTTGSVLTLDPASFLPLEWSESETSPDFVTDTIVAPGARYTWVCSGSPGSFDIDVWDGKRDQWCRQTRDGVDEAFLRPLYGLVPQGTSEPPAVAVIRPMVKESITLHAAHGTQLSRGQKIWLVEKSVIVHPCGDTLLGIELLRAPNFQMRGYSFVELSQKGAVLRATDAAARLIPGFDTFVTIQVVADAAAGLVFVRFDPPGGARTLVGIKTSGRGTGPPGDGRARPVETLFRLAVPPRTLLVEDPAGGDALAIARHEDGFEVVRLGVTAPVFRPGPPTMRTPAPQPPSMTRFPDCDTPSGARRRAVELDGGATYHQPDAHIRGRIAAAKRAGPIALLDLIGALRYAQNLRMAEEAHGVAVAAYPDHPEVLLLDARLQLADNRWDLTRERLLRIDPDALEAALARHVHHLLGLAHIMAGAREEALEVLRRGERYAGICDFGLGLALALPLDDAAAETRAWTPDDLVVLALRRAVAAADARLGDEDPEGAIRALDTLLVHDLGEVQTLARLAEALLAMPLGVTFDPFEQAQALAAFCGAHAETAPFTRMELPLSFPPWDQARLDALAARARAWLDGAPGTTG